MPSSLRTTPRPARFTRFSTASRTAPLISKPSTRRSAPTPGRAGPDPQLRAHLRTDRVTRLRLTGRFMR
jgi:hypothetical protein